MQCYEKDYHSKRDYDFEEDFSKVVGHIVLFVPLSMHSVTKSDHGLKDPSISSKMSLAATQHGRVRSGTVPTEMLRSQGPYEMRRFWFSALQKQYVKAG